VPRVRSTGGGGARFARRPARAASGLSWAGPDRPIAVRSRTMVGWKTWSPWPFGSRTVPRVSSSRGVDSGAPSIRSRCVRSCSPGRRASRCAHRLSVRGCARRYRRRAPRRGSTKRSSPSPISPFRSGRRTRRGSGPRWLACWPAVTCTSPVPRPAMPLRISTWWSETATRLPRSPMSRRLRSSWNRHPGPHGRRTSSDATTGDGPGGRAGRWSPRRSWSSTSPRAIAPPIGTSWRRTTTRTSAVGDAAR
jgi:hypothetical protein